VGDAAQQPATSSAWATQRSNLPRLQRWRLAPATSSALPATSLALPATSLAWAIAENGYA